MAAAGVGTIATGVAKGYADRILISGDSGGTGASPLSSIRHAGIPWEIGLAETQQTLIRNGLRGRVRLQTDGQLKTGRDVIVAACLGAEEYGFATAPLIAMGCVMMRQCHLNTCPVGYRHPGPRPPRPVHRHARPGGRVPLLRRRGGPRGPQLDGLPHARRDRSGGRSCSPRPSSSTTGRPSISTCRPLLQSPEVPHGTPVAAASSASPTSSPISSTGSCSASCKDALEHQKRVQHSMPISNRNRTVGTLLSYFVTAKYGEAGLREDTIDVQFQGSAGQSFGAFLTRGITLRVAATPTTTSARGSPGASSSSHPPPESTFAAGENIVVGNVALYGATAGEAYFLGKAGERFAVRNSGAKAVVEGIGDHGCEYMTGGVVVVLGPTGRNFAAGMSGGIAFIYDPDDVFRDRCNLEMVDLVPVEDYKDIGLLSNLVNRHVLIPARRWVKRSSTISPPRWAGS